MRSLWAMREVRGGLHAEGRESRRRHRLGARPDAECRTVRRVIARTSFRDLHCSASPYCSIPSVIRPRTSRSRTETLSNTDSAASASRWTNRELPLRNPLHGRFISSKMVVREASFDELGSGNAAGHQPPVGNRNHLVVSAREAPLSGPAPSPRKRTISASFRGSEQL